MKPLSPDIERLLQEGPSAGEVSPASQRQHGHAAYRAGEAMNEEVLVEAALRRARKLATPAETYGEQARRPGQKTDRTR